jgi:hypothetical protein
MSISAAPAIAPAGQAVLPGVVVTQPAAGDAQKPTAETPKATPSMLAAEPVKTEGQTTEAGGSKDGKPATTGELKITIPEGANVNPEALKSFESMAKATGLTSEAASKIVAWNLEQAKANDAAWAKQGQDWFNELSSDPDFGKANLEKSQVSVRRAVAKFFDSETLASLTEMGLDNHPGLVKALKRIGDTLKEDDSSTGSGGGNGAAARAADKASQLRTEYPSMFQEQK